MVIGNNFSIRHCSLKKARTNVGELAKKIFKDLRLVFAKNVKEYQEEIDKKETEILPSESIYIKQTMFGIRRGSFVFLVCFIFILVLTCISLNPYINQHNIENAQQKVDALFSDTDDNFLAKDISNAKISEASVATVAIESKDDVLYDDLTSRLANARIMFSLKKEIGELYDQNDRLNIYADKVNSNYSKIQEHLTMCRDNGKQLFADTMEKDLNLTLSTMSALQQANAKIDTLYVDGSKRTQLKETATIEEYNDAVNLSKTVQNTDIETQLKILQVAREEKAKKALEEQQQQTAAQQAEQQNDKSNAKKNDSQSAVSSDSSYTTITRPERETTSEESTNDLETDDDGHITNSLEKSESIQSIER